MIVIHMFNENKLNKNKGKDKYPKCIPVHLAQIGNCSHFKKKERSGFL